MKKFLFATVALVALGATVPALAADLGARAPYYSKAPAYAAPIYNWTGFYIGGHIGGAFASDNNFNGLVTGIIIALPALAITLLFGVLKFPNFAVGSIMTLAAYAVFALNVQLGWPLVLSTAAGSQRSQRRLFPEAPC